MAALWILPPAIVLVGLGLITVLVRSIGTTASELRAELVRLDDVDRAVALVRADARAARASLADLRQR